MAKNVELTSKAVREIGRRYEKGGLERALYEKQRPGAAPVLDSSQRQRIIAMVCADPPEGQARWTVRLMAAEAFKRKLVPRVGRETIRILLEGRDLKPWRENNVVRGRTQSRVHRKMEDVLAVYEKPYNAAEPVVCMDEKPVTLHAEVRPPIRMAPCKIAKRDNEYERRGTANVFCAVEPKAGRHFTLPTPNRSALEFAQALRRIVDHHPFARTTHLVMDNPNIHCRKTLTDYFGEGEQDGGYLCDRLTVHHTPTHGSWLNQAEIEISLFARQCLG